MYPDCDEILKMAPDYDIIPVCREIYADVITPITLLRKLAAVSKRYYLLESVEGGEKWGRYSFLGFDPVMRVKCSCGKVTIEKDGEETEKVTDKPLEVLREILKDYKAPRLAGLPPFAGGFVGYFAYAMIGPPRRAGAAFCSRAWFSPHFAAVFCVPVYHTPPQRPMTCASPALEVLCLKDTFAQFRYA